MTVKWNSSSNLSKIDETGKLKIDAKEPAERIFIWGVETDSQTQEEKYAYSMIENTNPYISEIILTPETEYISPLQPIIVRSNSKSQRKHLTWKSWDNTTTEFVSDDKTHPDYTAAKITLQQQDTYPEKYVYVQLEIENVGISEPLKLTIVTETLIVTPREIRAIPGNNYEVTSSISDEAGAIWKHDDLKETTFTSINSYKLLINVGLKESTQIFSAWRQYNDQRVYVRCYLNPVLALLPKKVNAKVGKEYKFTAIMPGITEADTKFSLIGATDTTLKRINAGSVGITVNANETSESFQLRAEVFGQIAESTIYPQPSGDPLTIDPSETDENVGTKLVLTANKNCSWSIDSIYTDHEYTMLDVTEGDKNVLFISDDEEASQLIVKATVGIETATCVISLSKYINIFPVPPLYPGRNYHIDCFPDPTTISWELTNVYDIEDTYVSNGMLYISLKELKPEETFKTLTLTGSRDGYNTNTVIVPIFKQLEILPSSTIIMKIDETIELWTNFNDKTIEWKHEDFNTVEFTVLENTHKLRIHILPVSSDLLEFTVTASIESQKAECLIKIKREVRINERDLTLAPGAMYQYHSVPEPKLLKWSVTPSDYAVIDSGKLIVSTDCPTETKLSITAKESSEINSDTVECIITSTFRLIPYTKDDQPFVGQAYIVPGETMKIVHTSKQSATNLKWTITGKSTVDTMIQVIANKYVLFVCSPKEYGYHLFTVSAADIDGSIASVTIETAPLKIFSSKSKAAPGDSVIFTISLSVPSNILEWRVSAKSPTTRFLPKATKTKLLIGRDETMESIRVSAIIDWSKVDPSIDEPQIAHYDLDVIQEVYLWPEEVEMERGTSGNYFEPTRPVNNFTWELSGQKYDGTKITDVFIINIDKREPIGQRITVTISDIYRKKSSAIIKVVETLAYHMIPPKISKASTESAHLLCVSGLTASEEPELHHWLIETEMSNSLSEDTTITRDDVQPYCAKLIIGKNDYDKKFIVKFFHDEIPEVVRCYVTTKAKDRHIGAIIGGVFGGLAGAALIGGATYYGVQTARGNTLLSEVIAYQHFDEEYAPCQNADEDELAFPEDDDDDDTKFNKQILFENRKRNENLIGENDDDHNIFPRNAPKYPSIIEEKVNNFDIPSEPKPPEQKQEPQIQQVISKSYISEIRPEINLPQEQIQKFVEEDNKEELEIVPEEPKKIDPIFKQDSHDNDIQNVSDSSNKENIVINLDNYPVDKSVDIINEKDVEEEIKLKNNQEIISVEKSDDLAPILESDIEEIEEEEEIQRQLLISKDEEYGLHINMLNAAATALQNYCKDDMKPKIKNIQNELYPVLDELYTIYKHASDDGGWSMDTAYKTTDANFITRYNMLIEYDLKNIRDFATSELSKYEEFKQKAEVLYKSYDILNKMELPTLQYITALSKKVKEFRIALDTKFDTEKQREEALSKHVSEGQALLQHTIQELSRDYGDKRYNDIPKRWPEWYCTMMLLVPSINVYSKGRYHYQIQIGTYTYIKVLPNELIRYRFGVKLYNNTKPGTTIEPEPCDDYVAFKLSIDEKEKINVDLKVTVYCIDIPKLEYSLAFTVMALWSDLKVLPEFHIPGQVLYIVKTRKEAQTSLFIEPPPEWNAKYNTDPTNIQKYAIRDHVGKDYYTLILNNEYNIKYTWEPYTVKIVFDNLPVKDPHHIQTFEIHTLMIDFMDSEHLNTEHNEIYIRNGNTAHLRFVPLPELHTLFIEIKDENPPFTAEYNRDSNELVIVAKEGSSDKETTMKLSLKYQYYNKRSHINIKILTKEYKVYTTVNDISAKLKFLYDIEDPIQKDVAIDSNTIYMKAGEQTRLKLNKSSLSLKLSKRFWSSSRSVGNTRVSLITPQHEAEVFIVIDGQQPVNSTFVYCVELFGQKIEFKVVVTGISGELIISLDSTHRNGLLAPGDRPVITLTGNIQSDEEDLIDFYTDPETREFINIIKDVKNFFGIRKRRCAHIELRTGQINEMPDTINIYGVINTAQQRKSKELKLSIIHYAIQEVQSNYTKIAPGQKKVLQIELKYHSEIPDNISFAWSFANEVEKTDKTTEFSWVSDKSSFATLYLGKDERLKYFDIKVKVFKKIEAQISNQIDEFTTRLWNMAWTTLIGSDLTGQANPDLTQLTIYNVGMKQKTINVISNAGTRWQERKLNLINSPLVKIGKKVGKGLLHNGLINWFINTDDESIYESLKRQNILNDPKEPVILSVIYTLTDDKNNDEEFEVEVPLARIEFVDDVPDEYNKFETIPWYLQNPKTLGSPNYVKPNIISRKCELTDPTTYVLISVSEEDDDTGKIDSQLKHYADTMNSGYECATTISYMNTIFEGTLVTPLIVTYRIYSLTEDDVNNQIDGILIPECPVYFVDKSCLFKEEILLPYSSTRTITAYIPTCIAVSRLDIRFDDIFEYVDVNYHVDSRMGASFYIYDHAKINSISLTSIKRYDNDTNWLGRILINEGQARNCYLGNIWQVDCPDWGYWPTYYAPVDYPYIYEPKIHIMNGRSYSFIMRGIPRMNGTDTLYAKILGHRNDKTTSVSCKKYCIADDYYFKITITIGKAEIIMPVTIRLDHTNADTDENARYFLFTGLYRAPTAWIIDTMNVRYHHIEHTRTIETAGDDKSIYPIVTVDMSGLYQYICLLGTTATITVNHEVKNCSSIEHIQIDITSSEEHDHIQLTSEEGLEYGYVGILHIEYNDDKVYDSDIYILHTYRSDQESDIICKQIQHPGETKSYSWDRDGTYRAKTATISGNSDPKTQVELFDESGVQKIGLTIGKDETYDPVLVMLEPANVESSEPQMYFMAGIDELQPNYVSVHRKIDDKTNTRPKVSYTINENIHENKVYTVIHK